MRARLRVLALAGALLPACADETSTRFAIGAAAGTIRMGPDERIAARIDPGLAVEVVEQIDAFELRLRSSAPFPSVHVDNGTLGDQRFQVALENIDPTAVASARLVQLPTDARRDPRCAVDARTGMVDVLLAPVEPVRSDDAPKTARFSLSVPPCRTLSVSLSLPRDTAEYRVAVFGNAGGSSTYVSGALDAARAADADYVHFLGGVATRERVSPFAAIGALADAFERPVGASTSPSDLQAGAQAYVDAWGQTDFSTRIGWMRLLVLDTADRRFSAEQFALLDAIDTSDPPGLALLGIGPFDPIGIEDDGFRSSLQADRLYVRLVRRGYRDVLSSVGSSWSHEDFGDLRLHDTGGHRAQGDDRHMVLVRLVRPWPALVACVDNTDCTTDESCQDGFCRERCAVDTDCNTVGTACDERVGTCRVPCADASACPEPAPECGGDGFCNLDPVIEVERVFY